MQLEKKLQELIGLFKIDTNIKSTAIKNLTADEKWKIVELFFASNPIGCIIYTFNKLEKSITFTFQDFKDADEFAKFGTKLLPSFARSYLKTHGEDPKIYSIGFDFRVLYDANDKKTNKVTLILV